MPEFKIVVEYIGTARDIDTMQHVLSRTRFCSFDETDQEYGNFSIKPERAFIIKGDLHVVEGGIQ